ncbi:ribosome assembly factor SBDS [Candidatus Parvarchaeota archaeon]|nr:ribosome assembly factor SBDS [Candidatus Acidifodinimicrobium mancum]MBE5729814.1 ribosome assembly factor SBDS [Candidatus Acidifodinimicrobium mancum]
MVEDKVIAKLQIKDKRFEIWVDCDKAMDIKNGKSNDIESALLVDKVFKDAKKGEVAGNLKDHLKTDDVYQAALKIIKEGEVQVSAAYREKQIGALKNRIIDEIVSTAIDATNNLPIPRKRIELALEQVHYNFDLKKPEKMQVEELIGKLKSILPLKIGEFSYITEVDPQYSSVVLSAVKRFAKVKGSDLEGAKIRVEFTVSPKDRDMLLSKLKELTHGTISLVSTKE